MKVDWSEWDRAMKEKRQNEAQFTERDYSAIPSLEKLLGKNWRVYYKMFFSWVKDQAPSSEDCGFRIIVKAKEVDKFVSILEAFAENKR